MVALMSPVATTIRSSASPCAASGIDYLSCEIWNISQDILDYWGDYKGGLYPPYPGDSWLRYALSGYSSIKIKKWIKNENSRNIRNRKR